MFINEDIANWPNCQQGTVCGLRFEFPSSNKSGRSHIRSNYKQKHRNFLFFCVLPMFTEPDNTFSYLNLCRLS